MYAREAQLEERYWEFAVMIYGVGDLHPRNQAEVDLVRKGVDKMLERNKERPADYTKSCVDLLKRRYRLQEYVEEPHRTINCLAQAVGLTRVEVNRMMRRGWQHLQQPFIRDDTLDVIFLRDLV